MSRAKQVGFWLCLAGSCLCLWAGGVAHAEEGFTVEGELGRVWYWSEADDYTVPEEEAPGAWAPALRLMVGRRLAEDLGARLVLERLSPSKICTKFTQTGESLEIQEEKEKTFAGYALHLGADYRFPWRGVEWAAGPLLSYYFTQARLEGETRTQLGTATSTQRFAGNLAGQGLGLALGARVTWELQPQLELVGRFEYRVAHLRLVGEVEQQMYAEDGTPQSEPTRNKEREELNYQGPALTIGLRHLF